MSGAADSRARASATKAIANYGTTCALTGSATQAGSCMELENGDAHFRNDSVNVSDRYFMLPASDYASEPQTADVLTVGDEVFTVLQVKRVKPGIDAILYYLRVST